MYQQYLNEARASISNLSSDELKDLLNDDDQLEHRIDELLKRVETEKESMLSENRAIAEENLAKEPVIIELKAKVNELAEEGQVLCKSVQEKFEEIKNRSGDMNQETLLALLQTAAAQSEEQSENIVKKFISSELSLDEFLEQFMPVRNLMHMRKAKAEKMIELIAHPQPPARNSGYFGDTSGGGVPYPSSSSGVPYPLGPMPMPMPMPDVNRSYF